VINWTKSISCVIKSEKRKENYVGCLLAPGNFFFLLKIKKKKKKKERKRERKRKRKKRKLAEKM
jgi:hypothetical protein